MFCGKTLVFLLLFCAFAGFDKVHLILSEAGCQGALAMFLELEGREEVYGMDFFNITYEELLKIRVDEAREDGLEEGMEKGIKDGTERGIASLVLDYCEEGFSKEKILGKLERRFDLSRDQAKAYYEQYAQNSA